jgi:ABC-type branched-subunit amino acid transport system substrate-binding protein
MQDAKIPRIAGNVANEDWGDQNAYPLDGSGTGVTFLQPQALINEGIKKIGTIRVDLAAASALTGFLKSVYGSDADFVYDTPVPGGTTDYTQFILGAQNAGAEGVSLPLGEQEATQVVKAGQQLDTKLKMAASLGTFPYSTVKALGNFAKQIAFVWSFAPATADIPVYQALRADLAASGQQSLQPENLKTSPMRSWIGLYATLKMIRDAKMTTFTREGMTTMLQQAKDVPMLDMFGGATWTPNLNHPGLFKRAGIDQWIVYTFDPNKKSGQFEGSFDQTSTISFDKTMCGSPLGGPC